MNTIRLLALGVLLAVAIGSVQARGQETTSSELLPDAQNAVGVLDPADGAAVLAMVEQLKQTSIPEELRDPAFDKFVDLSLLGEARRTMDAGLLTDVALQLAEGERVLMRSHKVVSSDQLFRLAAAWAMGNDSDDIVSRIKTAADRLGKKKVAALLQDSTKLLGAGRSLTAGFKVAIDAMTPEQYAELRGFLISLRDAQMCNDHETLAQMQIALEDLEGITEAQRKQLQMMIGESRTADQKGSEPEQDAADVLNILASSSRADNGKGLELATSIVNLIAEGIRRSGQNQGWPPNTPPSNPWPPNTPPSNPWPPNTPPSNPWPPNTPPSNPWPPNTPPSNPWPPNTPPSNPWPPNTPPSNPWPPDSPSSTTNPDTGFGLTGPPENRVKSRRPLRYYYRNGQKIYLNR